MRRGMSGSDNQAQPRRPGSDVQDFSVRNRKRTASGGVHTVQRGQRSEVVRELAAQTIAASG